MFLNRVLASRGVKHTVRLYSDLYDPRKVERVEDETDVTIVGAGPAGLAAAIRIKQLERERGKQVRVVVLDKGSEVGSHILSGAVLEPRALYELLGDPSTYASKYGSEAPLQQRATNSRMLFLTERTALPFPHPPQMNNEGKLHFLLYSLKSNPYRQLCHFIVCLYALARFCCRIPLWCRDLSRFLRCGPSFQPTARL